MKLFTKLCVCLFSGAALIGQSSPAIAQAPADTLHLSIQQAEEIFLQKNLQLLAQHYNVKSDSALIRQARLWDNPNLTVDQNVYVNNRFFEHGEDAQGNPTGQFYVQIQQLIQLGGKRHKAVMAAGANAAVTELQFEDLMRTLRQTLHKDFYTSLQLQRHVNLYQRELTEITRLISGMDAQYKAGNIARKDLLRVQAVQIGLQQEQIESEKSLEDVQQEFRTLLNVSAEAYVQPEGEKLSAIPALPSQGLNELISMARQHNTEYLIAQQKLSWQKMVTSYQKSLAVPDLNVGPNYDRASNFAPNYFGLTLGIPLPVFNRNQGNIRAAQYNVQQQQSLLDEEDVKLQNGVRAAYRKFALSVSIAGPVSTAFYNDYRQLFENIIESYRDRQISLVEFIDYLNGYEDIREKQLQQQLSIQLSKEDLNYEIGVDVIK